MCIRDSNGTGRPVAPFALPVFQAVPAISRCAPVSYTHLDVYKRQVRGNHASGSCRAGGTQPCCADATTGAGRTATVKGAHRLMTEDIQAENGRRVLPAIPALAGTGV